MHHAFGIEVGESRSFLHVRQHGRAVHPEPAVLSTSAPTVGEHLQERVLVDGVVTLAQSLCAVLVGGSETIVRLAAQPHEPVTGPDPVSSCRTSCAPYSTPRHRPTDDRRVDSARIRSDVRRNIRTATIRIDVGNNVLVVPGSRGRRRIRRPRPNRRNLYPSRITEKEDAPDTC